MNDREKRKKERRIEELKEAFEIIDQNGDGFITLKELGKFMKCFGQNPSQGELQDMINEVDVDGNGSIDFKSFLELMGRNLRDNNIEEELIETFKVFDQDNNGLINSEELFNVMKSFGQIFSKYEVEEMIRQADLDEDGYINYEEFAKMLLN